jgi:glyoxylase-like metal-dependent hydrolase (beta-lactamase superfamily II)
MLQLGDFTIHCIVENRIYLDAGSVYGIIPKSIWSKHQQADSNNLIPFDINVFVVQGLGHNIIFDAGLGDYLEDRQRKLYGTSQPSALTAGLQQLGLTPADIDIVILSHLHWDHAGGSVQRVNGRTDLIFPNARHYVHKFEWEDASNPDERTTGVYFPDRLAAIAAAGKLQLLDSDSFEIVPGVKVLRIGGHTRGQLGVEIESGGKKLIYYADNFPSCHHLKVPYVSATDLYPLDTQRCKRETLPKAHEGGWLIAMDHDIECKIVRLKYDGLKYTCEKVL